MCSRLLRTRITALVGGTGDPARLALLTATGEPIGWTYDAAQYAAVRAAILDAVELHAEAADGGVRLQAIVEHVQGALGGDPLFPSGRMTNATRYVAADLEGRGLLRRLPGRPVRVRAT